MQSCDEGVSRVKSGSSLLAVCLLFDWSRGWALFGPRSDCGRDASTPCDAVTSSHLCDPHINDIVAHFVTLRHTFSDLADVQESRGLLLDRRGD